MPDILLIQPPIRDFYLTAKRTQPYGLASIAASLRQCGFTVGICDGLATSKSRIISWPGQMDYLEPYYGRADRSPLSLFHHFRHFGYSIEHIAKQARESGAFLIGISSLFSAYVDVALETAEAVKKVCPKVPIVFGGHHPTALPESVMMHPAVDYVLRGEGEATLPALALAVRQGTSLENIPGLVRRKPNGTLDKAPPVVSDDLDALPTPAFDLINWRHYQRKGGGSLSLTASRGCPMKCTYCAVNAVTYHGYRLRSVQSVVSELKAAFELKPMGFIDFEDEHLCADRQWVLQLMSQIKKTFGQHRPELRAMNGLYAPNLDAQVVRSMQDAGLNTLNLALISTAADQLRRFARPDITKDVDRVLDLARSFNINCVAYIIVAGPGQDPCQSIQDLLYLARRRVLAGVSVFYPAPGSGDFDWCRRRNLLPEDVMLMRSTALPLAHGTDRLQAVTLLRLGRVLNFMKELVDRGESLPLPSKAPATIAPKGDRLFIGKVLVSAFFRDGNIYGLDDGGHLYAHAVDMSLVRRFISGLKKIDVRGVMI